VQLCAIPDKNLAVSAVFFFCSKGETNLGTRNFFLGHSGASRVCLGSLGGGEGGELNGGGDVGVNRSHDRRRRWVRRRIGRFRRVLSEWRGLREWWWHTQLDVSSWPKDEVLDSLSKFLNALRTGDV
jgi:hypothetical protein